MEATGKDIFYFIAGLYFIIYYTLWYSGKLKLSSSKEKIRKERLNKHGDVIKVIFFCSYLLILFLGIFLFI